MQPHEFWQAFDPPDAGDPPAFDNFYPARLADGRRLGLPLRALADGEHALASLILNQASFVVVEALAADLAARLLRFGPEIVVGLPTLGLTLAAAVAPKLGHARYVPLGTSRKFWYDEALSVPLASITTPGAGKRLYLDPRMPPLIRGQRVALIDDVISTGASLASALALLAGIGVEPVAIGAAMLQTERWRSRLPGSAADRVEACFSTPLFRSDGAGRWLAVR